MHASLDAQTEIVQSSQMGKNTLKRLMRKKVNLVSLIKAELPFI